MVRCIFMAGWFLFFFFFLSHVPVGNVKCSSGCKSLECKKLFLPFMQVISFSEKSIKSG